MRGARAVVRRGPTPGAVFWSADSLRRHWNPRPVGGEAPLMPLSVASLGWLPTVPLVRGYIVA